MGSEHLCKQQENLNVSLACLITVTLVLCTFLNPVCEMSSCRGQVLPAASLLNTVDVDLIYEGVKYCLKVEEPDVTPLSFLTELPHSLRDKS